MQQYTKLFNSIVTSTIWCEDKSTKILWITMLALSDKNGEVHSSVPGLARVADISIEECETALEKFMSPDRYSRTEDDEGRRIEKIEGGWSIINHRKYRDMASDADRRSQAAERQRRFREKQKRNADSNACVTQESPQNPHTDTDTDTEADTNTNPSNDRPTVVDLDRLQVEVKKLRKAWDQPFSTVELQLLKDAAIFLEPLMEEEWENIRKYLNWRKPEGDPAWQPRLLHKFLETAKTVVADAARWQVKRKSLEPVAPARVVPMEMDDEAKAEADKLFEMMKKK